MLERYEQGFVTGLASHLGICGLENYAKEKKNELLLTAAQVIILKEEKPGRLFVARPGFSLQIIQLEGRRKRPVFEVKATASTDKRSLHGGPSANVSFGEAKVILCRALTADKLVPTEILDVKTPRIVGLA